MKPSLIVVSGSHETEASAAIWSAFESMVGVRFSFNAGTEELQDANGLILVAPDDKALRAAIGRAQKCFVIPRIRNNPSGQGPAYVTFTGDAELDVRLQGRVLRHNPVTGFHALDVLAGDVVLARCDGVPCWIKRRVRSSEVHFVAFPLPRLRCDELPFHYLNGDQFMPLLPLLHFLRERVGPNGWRPPPLRACLMFDDPNLHWPSYGYLSYKQLALLAEREHFHVAAATVPLDSWYVHRGAAAIFKDNPQHLSLLIHGNDHTRCELGAMPNDVESLRRLGQALRRIETLERRSGVRVSRVMAPPHGACRPFITGTMSRLGFHGACISPWSLMDWAEDRRWPWAFGLQPTELMDADFPVVPRFRMSADCEGWIVVNAFLNRPIIPVGHHDSIRHGLELVSTVAAFINAIPNVRWTNVETILRSSFLTQLEGTTLHLRPFSSSISVCIPPGTTSLTVAGEANWISLNSSDTIVQGRNCWSVVSHSVVELRRSDWGTVDFRTVPSRHSLWAPVRRILCEARDRVQPLVTH